jgi:allophanate hydrolase subunit 2
MSSIEVTSPGFLTTVQDRGRPGYARFGVSACGAADDLALRLGNRLVGNGEDAAALEQTLAGGTFVFAAETRVALTGTDMEAACDGEPFPAGTARTVAAGGTVSCRGARRGARSYLCIAEESAWPLCSGADRPT